MKKGDLTRQGIVAEAAQVFSKNGFAGTSLSDLMEATQLTKGGIYNHFGSKEQLALESFDYAVDLTRQRLTAILKEVKDSAERLIAVVEVFHSIIEQPMLEGGCVLLNTSVEADDTNPQLRERAQQAMDEWRTYITRTVTRGIEKGQIKPDTDAETVATMLMASLEGAVMLSKLYDDPAHMRRTAAFLTNYIRSIQTDELESEQ
jgi:TetR/AcrR family transcriptional regulator, transcriptional repressor for nem operon